MFKHIEENNMGMKILRNEKSISMISITELKKIAKQKDKKGHKCRTELMRRGHYE